MNHYGDPTPAPIPACVHIHGGEVPPVLDGGPDAWFTSDGAYHGHAFYSKDGINSNYSIYKYPNVQEASPVWFHDHVLGITRLNVYAGLAGAYVIIDPELTLPTGLHPVGLKRSTYPVDYIVPMVIQDRMFDTTGELYFPNIGINPEHPYWIPEFLGDTIVVNGKTWPFMDVEPRRYRFLFINGSNARTYEMFLTNPVTKINGPPMYQIGTDGGYLELPTKIDPNAPKGQLQKLRLMPGERADVIIDFAGLQGQILILRNTGKSPYPAGSPPSGSTVGKIIQFRVQNITVTDDSYNPVTGGLLRPNIPLRRLVDPTAGILAADVVANKTRLLTLNEIIGLGGPLEILVNNTRWNGLSSDTTTFPGGIRTDFNPISIGGNTTYYSETPDEGDTELWEIVNLTADAHPIHTHLTQFQLMNRQAFNVNQYNGAYATAFGGVFKPAYGPPLLYNSADAILNPLGKFGGNPDVIPYLQGPVILPDLNERGWKDTIMMLPGQVTRIAIRYAPMSKAINDPDMYYPFDPNADNHGFVWHCHIIDHEDNEMMRPYNVNPKNGVIRTVTDY
jgi:FtsP/CotA-like multicopper oxidase with cupredoxin domain